MISPTTDLQLPDAWLHDGEWARVGVYFIYPRNDGQFYIGKRDGDGDYYDVDIPAFANMQAAIDHASWMVSEAAIDAAGGSNAQD